MKFLFIYCDEDQESIDLIIRNFSKSHPNDMYYTFNIKDNKFKLLYLIWKSDKIITFIDYYFLNFIYYKQIEAINFNALEFKLNANKIYFTFPKNYLIYIDNDFQQVTPCGYLLKDLYRFSSIEHDVKFKILILNENLLTANILKRLRDAKNITITIGDIEEIHDHHMIISNSSYGNISKISSVARASYLVSENEIQELNAIHYYKIAQNLYNDPDKLIDYVMYLQNNAEYFYKLCEKASNSFPNSSANSKMNKILNI